MKDEKHIVFDRIHPESDKPFLFLCDHGGSGFVDSGNSGLSAEQLKSDVVCDWGTSALTEILSTEMQAFAIISRFSRLVVDLNRYPTHEDCIPEITQRGFSVPGNQALSYEAKQERLDRFFWPYHDAVTQKILDLKSAGITRPAIVSVHSFAPEYHGVKRPWEIGVLFDKDERLSGPFINALQRGKSVSAGVNEPYTARDEIGFGFSVDYHAVFRGAPHIMLEVRQDELETSDGVRNMASLIRYGLETAFAEADI